MVKTNENGTKQWDITLGETGTDEEAFCVQETSDECYIITGSWNADAFLIKIDKNGNDLWNKTFGKSGVSDSGKSVEQTSDGGFIITGDTQSYGDSLLSNVWLIKTDADGTEEWNQTFGPYGTGFNRGYSVQQTDDDSDGYRDDGYIITGEFSPTSRTQVWLIKVNESGVKQWDKTFGKVHSDPKLDKYDHGYSVKQTEEGNYVVLGDTESYGVGGADIWLIKTDPNGNELWNKTFGDSDEDFGRSLDICSNGGYIIAGSHHTLYGPRSVYIIKTDADGNEETSAKFGDYTFGLSVRESSVCHYIIAGVNESGRNDMNMYLLKMKITNYPPNTPTIDGPTYGKAGKIYEYEFITTDPDEDDVSYYIDWGDGTHTGWIGPLGSGVTLAVSHSWPIDGTYIIKSKAKDNYGGESDWGTFIVKMPVNIFGNTQSGSYSQNIKDKITGSKFTMLANGTADNISVYIQTNLSPSPKTKCMIYKVDNSELIGTTEEKIMNTEDNATWITFNFTDPKPTLVRDTEYVLVSWSNNTCKFFYDNTTSEQGRYRNETYSTNSSNPISWTSNESKNYSIFCRYTTKPEITNTNALPNTVGFGFNVTICADIDDNGCLLENVTVNITYPDETCENFTMNNTENNTYNYVFNDTWIVGSYNYTIWAVDELGETNTSSEYNFNISVQATISIATLKDIYGTNEYINITDPPTPPSDYYLTGRGLTWDKYYNANTGKNILEVSAGPINYQDENNEWNPIECNLSMLSSNHPAYQYGYRAGNEHGLYNVYFKPNAQNSWPVAFAYNKSNDSTTQIVRSKLVGVGYLDPASNWDYKILQQAQSSQGQIDSNSAVYKDVFSGTDVTWSYQNTQLKEEITLNNTTKTLLQNHPPSEYGLNDETSYLVFITKLDHQTLNMYNSSGMLTGNVTINDDKIDFKDALGNFKCAMPIGDAYELNNESAKQKLTYRIIQYNGDTYLLSGLKLSDLNDMMFPVVIDPTLTVVSLGSDGYIYNSNMNYNTAWGASTGTVSSSDYYLSIGQKKTSFPFTYYVYRGFLLFNTSSLSTNACIDNATLSLYKKDDYSTTDFIITVQNGQPTYPHNPLEAGDYNKGYYSGDGGGLNTQYFVNGRNNISLTNLSWVAKGGTTKLCLRSSRDISGTTPTGNEYVNVYAYYDTLPDYVPKLIIEYWNQSKIKNVGSTNISGYLLMQVHYYNEISREWIVDNDSVNETTPRIIGSGSQLALDTIFNGLVKTSDLSYGNGLYRVYAAFRDPDGNVLVTDDETELEAWYEFDVNT